MKNIFNSEVDVAVLFIFFTRTEISKRTFEQIQKARPSRLYLYQDGPRQGREDDVENIAACRKQIESMIDWDCEVHKLFQTHNYGCDPSEFLSQKWMFETETKGIIIEDDDVMSVSFFRYCKELLDKYEYDTRFNIICGMNHLGEYKKCPYDYFFSRTGGAIWGWATWKRVIDQWDPDYDYMTDDYCVYSLYSEFGQKIVDELLHNCKAHKMTGKEHYETILGSNAFINNYLNIIPTRNMTCNIGVDNETTHSVSDITKLPRAIRRMLYMKTYECDFPLKHPKFIQADYDYWKNVQKLLHGNWFVRTFKTRKIESLLYRLFPILGK